MSNVSHSDYWSNDIEEFNTRLTDNNPLLDFNMIRLASARRAISNFVRILTNKSIPVTFNGKESFTDGENVVLGASIIGKEDFDPAVGLALHEGSHILLTDFSLVRTIWMKVPREIYDITDVKNISKDVVGTTVKYIWNVIEDRFIDNYIYKNAPGYRGYYIALYKKYFHSDSVNEMLRSKMYREPSIEAYKRRICNLMNINTDLKALPELQLISQMIDIKNISRLANPIDRINLAYEVSLVIFRNVCADPIDQSAPDPTAISMPVSGSAKDDPATVLGGTETSASSSPPEKQNDIEFDLGNTTDMSKSKLTKIKNALDKQDDFLNGTTKKKKISPYQKTMLDAIDKSGMTIERVGKEAIEGQAISGIDCVVVRNLTKELLLSDGFPLKSNSYSNKPSDEMESAIRTGIIMGNLLGKKLLLRNENNVAKYMRRSEGNIDSRIIAELGINNDRIFYTNQTEKYNDAYIHICIDASASMGGMKWYKTMSTVVAICKACSMIENIRVEVSFRTTISTKRCTQNPYIIFAYDSAKDKFSKISNLFKYIEPNGFTPEGLLFEIVTKICQEKLTDQNCYFLNFSDGEPCLPYEAEDGKICHYTGEKATLHTRKQVNSIKDKGYRVLSYFIQSNGTRHDRQVLLENRLAYKNFKTMYGKDASFIDVKNVNAVANTINELFLKKVE